jgi:nitrate/nitrite-specific signal transduction histidine kinase
LNLTDTIDLVELMVVILGAIGLTISLIMVAYIQGDRRNVRKSGTNGISKRLTNADLRNELSRTSGSRGA